MTDRRTIMIVSHLGITPNTLAGVLALFDCVDVLPSAGALSAVEMLSQFRRVHLPRLAANQTTDRPSPARGSPPAALSWRNNPARAKQLDRTSSTLRARRNMPSASYPSIAFLNALS